MGGERGPPTRPPPAARVEGAMGGERGPPTRPPPAARVEGAETPPPAKRGEVGRGGLGASRWPHKRSANTPPATAPHPPPPTRLPPNPRLQAAAIQHERPHRVLPAELEATHLPQSQLPPEQPLDVRHRRPQLPPKCPLLCSHPRFSVRRVARLRGRSL